MAASICRVSAAGAVHPLAGGIDRDHAGHKDELARPDCRREWQVQVRGHIDSRVFRCDHVALQSHGSFSRDVMRQQ
jgi:hypothetical protein